ncbi:centromere-associated protein E isoform X2 [Xiphias gladius]|uniref:centromere-associated protein E isoform X2 n=1 Tax=Xiphias gladius TaxID=8245 RepID=UPI001A97D56D|nr:centromere-associated protein E isoform X2 [Xiphias gladius]
MTEESAVKVCVRVRPLIAREESAASENPEPVQLFWKADKKSIHQIDDGNSTKSFSFDRVFTAEETTNQLYQDIAKPLVVSTVEGYNGTIFAYGQTSSGKTFTMMGSDHIPGVIPVAVEDVFQTIKNCPKKEFLLRVSYMEIYNETVTDLLVDSWKRKPLEVRETISKNIYVADLTEELVTSPTQALAWIRKGEKNRHYGKTKMNQRSSRSHAIFRMILESRERSDPASGENADGAIIVSHLNLVDLAGSERASQTGAEGTRFKEGCNINRSLFTLGQVIKKLTDESQKGFTNYRDSKLTRILQNSLGGNAKTVIICTITPVTLDETLSTLQFASTAKKMKNDPHVTEVSDDGALLKRYRNEIVDLKRRLHEVSSVTQTTATEKEVLAQLLQEKDQLQREQEDRIKNLTKLLVTSSNLIPAKKMPKRRVTWGGKMLRLARPSACDGGSSDLSFADPFTRKRKADRSCLMELGEDDEDFDSHWEISDEPPDEMEMSQSCVTVRSFGDSPKDFVSPDRMRELSGKVSNLELQLELESQQKEEAMTKVETLDDRVAELQLQLQTEAQQKQGALEKIQTIEQRAAELEQQQRAEAQQKLQAMDKAEMLELKVADLERQLEEQRCGQTEPDEQMRREFAETIQLCETLASEKDMVVAERDYLKQELGMFIEQTESLEKEKAALSQELEEKREMNEFKSLEEECRKEHENELQNEISSLKKAIESSELQCQELQNKLETLSEELKKKTEFAEELQSMSGKDLVQEVAKLRRSLDDAEGVSRDTKKEWAVLRSENLALTEMNVILTANHEKMEAEVNSLRFQLETEKSHYRKMQSDLQKELNVVFDENTKLTILLDGKVPKNLLDSVELERTVASLNKELTASRKAEGILRAQLEELASFQTLPEKVDNLMKQLDQLNEEFQRVRVEKEALLSEKNAGAEQMEKLLSTVTSLTAERDQLRMNLQQNVDLVESLSQELQCVRCEKETLPIPDAQGSAEEITKLLSTVASVTAERDQLKMDLQENVEMMIENQEELRKTLEKNRSQKLRIRQLEAEQTPKPHGSLIEMNEQLKTLQTHIQSLTEERESLLFEKTVNTQTSTEEKEKLLCRVSSLSEERDQLQETLQVVRQEKNQLKAELEHKTEMIQSLTVERESLLFEKTVKTQTSTEEMERLSQEKQQGRVDLEDRMDTLQSEIVQLQTTLHITSEQKNKLESDLQHKKEMVAETQSLLQTLHEQLQEQNQRNIDLERLDQERQAQQEKEFAEGQCLLHSLQEKLQEQEQKMLDLGKLCEQKESDIQQQREAFFEELKGARAERDALLFEKESSCQASTEEMEKLLCRVSSLSEERDQLQETLQVVRQEKNQLKAELEDKTEMMQYELQQQLSSEAQSLKEEQEDQRLLQIQQLENHLENTKEELSQLKSDLKENIDLMIENQEELRVSHEKIRVLQDEINVLRNQKAELESRPNSGDDAESIIHLQELRNQIQSLTEELDSVRAERDSLLSESTADTQTSTEEMEKLLCRVSFLSEERDQLQETLQGLRQEKNHLKAELEDKIEILQTEVSTTQELLKSVQEELREQKQMNSDLQKLSQEKESSLIQQIRTLTAKLENTKAERDSLCSEKEASCQTSTEEMEKLLCSVSSLSEERDQLQETLQGLRQEKNHLKAELEDKIEILQTEVSTTQELLKSVQEELREQKQMNSDLQKLSQEKESSLIQQIRTLTAKLENTKAERDSLCSEKEASCQTSTEQMERLLCSVTSLSEERNQLQETLQALRQEKNQLRTELENRMETFSVIQEKLSEQEQLNVQQQSERGKQEAKLQQEVQQLEEQLQMYRERQTGAKAEADALQQLLSEANTTISALREQLSSLDQHATGVKETVSSRLLDSTVQLQESFRGLQQFVDNCSTYSSTPMDKALRVQSSLKDHYLISLPKPTMDAYTTLCQLGLQTAQSLGNIIARLRGKAQAYRNLFEELVKKDLAVYEERRLQDVLLCRVQAPSYSVKEEELHTLWEHRLTELLDKRQLYQQKMASILEKLWANMDSYPNQLSAEIREREMFNEQLQAVFTTQPINFSRLDSILSCELDRRSAVAHAKKMALQGITDEQSGLFEELKLLEAQADSQLREEKSKRSTLLQALEGAPLKTELSLLKDNQQLVLQLQQTEEKVRVLRVQNEQLEEAQVKANNRVSNHKQATQLLQTELQDSRAQIEEKENAIQTLRSKLRESEKNASPSAVELEKVRTKLFKMEVEMSSASDKHQLEIQRLTTVLNEKEDSLRKLREALRRSQQRGEESFLQGEDLHAKLTNPRGLVIKSSILLEKTRLEEEVKRLQLKITELESLTSTQQGEISKWKSRTAKLKMKNKADVNKPSSPCTPTKSGLPMTSESPRKLPASPKVSLLNSPKSRFFDVGGSSELLSRTCPKQFFDNSSLGTIPEVSHVPDTADAEKDADAGAVAAAGAARKDEWWPQSPKQDDMCSTQ